MELSTPRLVVVPASIEVLQAVLDDHRALASALASVTIPTAWPGNHDALVGLPIHLAAMRANPAELPWRIRLIASRADRIAIGSISLKGPPRDGTVEIGWGLITAARKHGFAREAAAVVVEWLRAQPSVHRIIATIDDANLPSIRIAEHLGMSRIDRTLRGLPVHELSIAAS